MVGFHGMVTMALGKKPISSSESSITKRHSPVDSSYRPGPRSDRVKIEPFFPQKKPVPLSICWSWQVSRNCSRETYRETPRNQVVLHRYPPRFVTSTRIQDPLGTRTTPSRERRSQSYFPWCSRWMHQHRGPGHVRTAFSIGQQFQAVGMMERHTWHTYNPIPMA